MGGSVVPGFPGDAGDGQPEERLHPRDGNVMHHQPWDPPWSRTGSPVSSLVKGDRDQLQVVFYQTGTGLVWPESVLRNAAYTDHKQPRNDGSRLLVSVTRLGTGLPPATQLFRFEGSPDSDATYKLVAEN